MKIRAYLSKLVVIIALAISAIFLSCDEFKDVEYDIAISIICSGGSSTTPTIKDIYSAMFVIDSKTFNIESTTITIPAGNVNKVTISATRYDPTSSLTILFKNGQIDEKGYANLTPCVSTSTTGTPVYTCTNNLSLAWELDAKEDETKAVSGSTSTTGTSTTGTSTSE